MKDVKKTLITPKREECASKRVSVTLVSLHTEEWM